MKNLIQKIFFGVVLMGQCSVCDAFESLKQRSPFGDAAPKPIVKLPPKVSAEPAKPAPPPPPKKPDLKIELSGYLKMGKKEYFAICDKTSKDLLHTVIENHIASPLGYDAFNYDGGKQVLELKVDGHNYSCPLGGTDKKTNTGTAPISNSWGNANISYDSGMGSHDNYGVSPYDDDFNWDDWDDDWWDNWSEDDW
jgi:hypothetical protein